MDYHKALELSSSPHLTLSQAFTHITGRGISVRLVQKLIKQYDERLILNAILSMKGREIDEPVPYLLGVCRNMNAAVKEERLAATGHSFDRTIGLFNEANLVGERPKLRSPFNGVAT